MRVDEERRNRSDKDVRAVAVGVLLVVALFIYSLVDAWLL